MKKQLLKPTLILTTAAAATLFTGCASMQTGGYSGLEEPVNTLAFTSATDPVQLSKWTGSKFLFQPMQSQDIYYFQVPNTGYEPGRTTLLGEGRYDVQPGSTLDTASDTMRDTAREPMRVGDVDHREIGAGMGASGTYGTGSGGEKVIRHQPGGAAR